MWYIVVLVIGFFLGAYVGDKIDNEIEKFFND